MINHDSSFLAKSRYNSKYYPLNSIPETQYLIEAELLETTADKTNIKQSSVKEVMFALGVIVTLIVGTTWYLYSSLKTTPINSLVTEQTEILKTVSSANPK